METKQKRYLRRAEVAEELGVSLNTVKEFIADGLREVYLGKRTKLIDRVDLDAYMEARKV